MMNSMIPGAVHNDAGLVGAALAGDRDAFGQIVSRCQSLICSLAYSATGSLDQSQDLAQETFLTAWRRLANLREPEKLRAWLCGIARNLIHQALRRQTRESTYGAEPIESVSENRSPDLNTPVIDRTGLTNNFDIDLTWAQSDWRNVNAPALKTALLNRLGLELVPANMPVQMLVVEKAADADTLGR